jgi:hypothetical protein
MPAIVERPSNILAEGCNFVCAARVFTVTPLFGRKYAAFFALGAIGQ